MTKTHKHQVPQWNGIEGKKSECPGDGNLKLMQK